MVFLVLLVETIKMSYQTEHLNKLGIYYIRKKLKKCFYLNKNIYDYKRHIFWAYIQNLKSVRQELWEIKLVQRDGRTDGQKRENWRTSHLVVGSGYVPLSISIQQSKNDVPAQ